MKRTAANDTEHSSKRHKGTSRDPTPDPFETSLRRIARDVYANGTDGSGFISGQAFMVWPSGGSGVRRMVMETRDGQIERFEVKLTGLCRKYFDRLDFTAKDCFELSLKGAELDNKQESSKPFYLPMVLTFKKGVVIRFTKRYRKPDENGLVVDTWKLAEADKRRAEMARLDEEAGRSSWFTTPVRPPSDRLLSTLSLKVDPSEPLVQPHESSNPVTPVSNDNFPPAPKPITPSGEVQRHKTTSSSIPTQSNHPETALDGAKSHVTRPQMERSRAGDVLEEISKNTVADTMPVRDALPDASNNTNSGIPPASTSNHAEEQNNASASSTIPSQKLPSPQLTKKQQRLRKKAQRAVANAASASHDGRPASVPNETPQTASEPIAATTVADVPPASNENVEEPNDPSLDIQAGFWTEIGDKYTPLSDATGTSLYNLAGVVTSIRPTQKTRNEDLYCSLTLVDPSSLDVDNVMWPVDGLGATINCFTAKYEGWLPSPKIGDILIVRGAKAGGSTLVGYKNRLRWAIYDPEAGKIHHGDRGDAPESEGLADGFGYEFCPFWKPREVELAHCLRLSDWWHAALKKIKGKMGHVHQIGGDVFYSKPRREHRLISEASPDLPPNGFFDCTVEIIKGFLNDNDVYSLYVTDYTTNPRITPVQGSWCPPSLEERILKVEMWDTASQLGQTMEPGEYWFLRNARMKISDGGYLEGTMQLAEKVQKLNENDLTRDPHLEALLERKREWERIGQPADGPFGHQFIEDVKKNQFFDCTVEILDTYYNPNGLSYIYITDYTHHPDLPVVPAINAWSRGLDKRIVKVVLLDEQMAMAKTVETGCYYTIRKLRLLQSTTGGQFQGRLGGAERLIHRLRSTDSSNVRLAALLKRKDAWQQQQADEYEQSLETKDRETNGTKPSISYPYPLPGFNSINEILASQKCPNKFRLVARIKEFYPLHLDECVILRCMKCQETLRPTWKQCVKCSDMVDSHVKCLYCFCFLLEDEEGKNLLISISDEDCSLLRGLEPADLREDLESLEEFTERLRPIIGNLLEVHRGIERGESIAPETPTLKLTIESWRNPESISFGLMDLELLPDL